jgi:hypothetical protein
MKAKFLYRLILFLLPIIAISVALEIYLAPIPNSYTTKRAQLAEVADSVEILIMGPSYMLIGVDPDYITAGKAYNLANNSQTIYYDSELLKDNIDSLPNLKLVVFNFGYTTLCTKLTERSEWWRAKFYKRYWNIDNPNLNRDILLSKSRIRLYGIKQVVKFLSQGFGLNLASDIKSNGYQPYYNDHNYENINEASGKERHDYYLSTCFEKNVESNLDSLYSICKILEHDSINFLFVATPVYKTYSQNLSQIITKRNDREIKKLCKEYDTEYYDYTYDERFIKTDFYDNDHLDVHGAEKFSKILNREVLIPYFKTRSDTIVNYSSTNN